MMTASNQSASHHPTKTPKSASLLCLTTMKRKNTLSKARGKQQKAENVWFKRTGAGYRLFVEYYAAQTVGVVVCEKIPSKPAPKSKPAANKQGQGMSRAAKRRKKKKNLPVDIHQTESSPKVLNGEPVSSLFTSSELATHLQQFLMAMSKPLPLTFRIRHSAENPSDFQKSLEEYKDIVSPLPFDENIYQATIPKAALSTTCPALKDLLVRHSQDGTLARQELGSMLPVLALTQAGYLRRSSRVLDVCASPGSKTLQALEIIGESGQIVANDILESRLDALREAVERCGMPRTLTDRITYTNQDATQLKLRTERWAEVVLCDVPCSGDGTCRKDKHILPMWKPNYANQLHGTQVEILVRSIQLLKVGGAICYSTCSLNPVEDEAVVAEALRRTRNVPAGDDGSPAMELIECPDLTGLIQRAGVGDWKVADYAEEEETATSSEQEADDEETIHIRWHKSWQDAVDAGMDKPRKSLWPTEDNSKLCLNRCIRLWPQDQDSGGFFLAIIRKNR
jgi:tRNA (cytosine34-C5)-methyltransferase